MRCQTLEVYLMVFTVKLESKPFTDLKKKKKGKVQSSFGEV